MWIRNSTSKCTLILLSSSEHKTKIQNIWDICAFTAVVKALALSGAQCAFTTLISLIYIISKMCQPTIFKYFAFYLWQTFENFLSHFSNKAKLGQMSSLNTQSFIKVLLVVRDFCFWAVWAAGPVLKKKFWANYERLLRAVFFMYFCSRMVLEQETYTPSQSAPTILINQVDLIFF